MKTIRTQTLFASFVIAILLLLNISSALAGGHETAINKPEFRGRIEVTFTKWITDYPNMAGVVSVSCGDGTYVRFGGNYQNVSLAWQYSWLDRPN
jgi:hypothetical protein